MDDTTNLQYLRARWYDPSIERFVQEDTYEGEQTNPLSLNLYTYVSNNPLIYTDPSGHWQKGDENYATAIQHELRHLTKLYNATDDRSTRKQIHASANALRSIGNTGANYSVIRLNTFIPTNRVSVPFGTFAGDGANRGFDVHSNRVRTQQYIVVNNATGKTTAMNYVGKTHKITEDGVVKARASNNGMKVETIRQKDTIFVYAEVDTKNPLVNNAPPINYLVYINTNDGRIAGVANNFPAYEMYINMNGRGYSTMHQYMPSYPNFLLSPFLLYDIFTHKIK